MTTQVCPQCKTPVPREGSRFCNQCGADLREFAAASKVGDAGVAEAQSAAQFLPSVRLQTGPAETITMASQDESNLPVAVPEAALHILLRDGSVIERDLSAAETRLGKGARNDIILPDASVSNSHALIRRENGGFILSDLGSRNGTLLNEARLSEPRPLQHGDLIKMGHCTITFRLRDVESTASMPRTVLLGDLQPPPPPAPPGPKKIAITEDALAQALVAAGLVASGEMERVRGGTAGRRLARALLEENLVTEIGLRDLMSRTFNLAPVGLQTMEVDAATAVRLRPEFLRERLVCPVVGQQPDRLMLAVADPTDRATLEEIERRLGKSASLRLAMPSEIVAQLDAHFTPRLVGVTPTGEKLETLLNQSELEIGKAAHNKLVIADPTVSSTHAIVLARDGGYSIVDLGSSNGTFINDQRLGAEAHTLQHGDKIQLGQVVLAFRNPAETTENKTARLSPEALEEIRQRAMGQPAAAGGVRTDRASWSIPAANVATTANSDTVETEEERAERKRKKKEKDKNSWFSPNALSRIVAQILGASVMLLGTYFLISRNQQPSNNGSSSGGGGANSGAVVTERFAALGSWHGFNTGLFGGALETSSVAAVPGTNGVLMVVDSDNDAARWVQLDESGKQVGSIKKIPLGVSFDDPEAITYGGGYAYLLASQADPTNGPRNAIVRFDFNSETQTQRSVEMIPDLRAFLLQNVTEIATLGTPSGKDGGLNIEGLAWDPINERLLLGLRSPLLGNQAVVIPLKLRERRGAFNLDNLKVDEPRVMFLALEGHGVRDLTYDPRLKSFLIISGAPENEKKTDFVLWEWTGQSDARPTKLMTLDDKMKPEGISSVTIGGRSFVFLVGDAGSYLKLDYANTR